MPKYKQMWDKAERDYCELVVQAEGLLEALEFIARNDTPDAKRQTVASEAAQAFKAWGDHPRASDPTEHSRPEGL
jgi:hypothetical protein